MIDKQYSIERHPDHVHVIGARSLEPIRLSVPDGIQKWEGRIFESGTDGLFIPNIPELKVYDSKVALDTLVADYDHKYVERNGITVGVEPKGNLDYAKETAGRLFNGIARIPEAVKGLVNALYEAVTELTPRKVAALTSLGLIGLSFSTYAQPAQGEDKKINDLISVPIELGKIPMPVNSQIICPEDKPLYDSVAKVCLERPVLNESSFLGLGLEVVGTHYGGYSGQSLDLNLVLKALETGIFRLEFYGGATFPNGDRTLRFGPEANVDVEGFPDTVTRRQADVFRYKGQVGARALFSLLPEDAAVKLFLGADLGFNIRGRTVLDQYHLNSGRGVEDWSDSLPSTEDHPAGVSPRAQAGLRLYTGNGDGFWSDLYFFANGGVAIDSFRDIRAGSVGLFQGGVGYDIFRGMER
ncbi:MAG: hypothetical protein ABIH82_02125 [Candidatus Woesearchaeota archaeon]